MEQISRPGWRHTRPTENISRSIFDPELLREISHGNVVKLVNVHINYADMSLYLAFDYDEHDLYEIIRHHREKLNHPIDQYTVKSLLWQLINGFNYLHRYDREEHNTTFDADSSSLVLGDDTSYQKKEAELAKKLIKGGAPAVKKALVLVSCRLHDNPSRSHHLLASGMPQAFSQGGPYAYPNVGAPVLDLGPLEGPYGGYKRGAAEG